MQLRRVYWVNKSLFVLFQTDRCVLAWWMPGKWYLFDCIMSTLQFSGGETVLWGVFRVALKIRACHKINGIPKYS